MAEQTRKNWRQLTWEALKRDLIARPVVSPVFGAVLGALIVLIGVLTWNYAGGGTESCDLTARPTAERGQIHVIWGLTTLVVVAFIAIVAGLEPIIADPIGRWARGVRRWFGDRKLAWRLILLLLFSPILLVLAAIALFAWLCSKILSLLDIFLAQICARLAGATVGGLRIFSPEQRGWATLLRYSIFAFWVVGGGMAVGYFAPPGLALIGIALGVLAIFGVIRRWGWVEADREAFLIARKYDDRTMRVGFLEDLRDEALLGVACLFVLIPLALRQVYLMDPSPETGAFVICGVDGGAPVLIDWLGFFGVELLKAAPLVDWSEVFNVTNASPIKPNTELGAQMVFSLRAILDLLLLGSVVTAVQIATRLRDQAAAFENNLLPILDPFSEGRRLLRVGVRLEEELERSAEYPHGFPLETVLQHSAGFPAYAPERLAQIAGVRTQNLTPPAVDPDSLAPASRSEAVRLAALGVLLSQSPSDVPEEPAEKYAPVARLALLARRERTRERVDPPKDLPLPETTRIPGGVFAMGSKPDDPDARSAEQPQRKVLVPAFEMGKYAVTFEEYEAFCAATGREVPDDEGWGKGRHPVINVSWYDAQAYAAWLREVTGEHWRLPSEAEWEYACRAGTTGKWSFGDDESKLGEYAWFRGNSASQTHPVGENAANDFGLHDMHGNVWEWCQDPWRDDYQDAPTDGSAWLGGDMSLAVLRGGSWYNSPQSLRSANRNRLTRVIRNYIVGFRVARTIIPR